jgi:hypothetical protein
MTHPCRCHAFALSPHPSLHPTPSPSIPVFFSHTPPLPPLSPFSIFAPPHYAPSLSRLPHRPLSLSTPFLSVSPLAHATPAYPLPLTLLPSYPLTLFAHATPAYPLPPLPAIPLAGLLHVPLLSVLSLQGTSGPSTTTFHAPRLLKKLDPGEPKLMGSSSLRFSTFWVAQDYRVHIKHMDGSFEYIPYFCLPANDLNDVIAPSCYSCFDYPNALADLVQLSSACLSSPVRHPVPRGPRPMCHLAHAQCVMWRTPSVPCGAFPMRHVAQTQRANVPCARHVIWDRGSWRHTAGAGGRKRGTGKAISCAPCVVSLPNRS